MKYDKLVGLLDLLEDKAGYIVPEDWRDFEVKGWWSDRDSAYEGGKQTGEALLARELLELLGEKG